MVFPQSAFKAMQDVGTTDATLLTSMSQKCLLNEEFHCQCDVPFPFLLLYGIYTVESLNFMGQFLWIARLFYSFVET